MTTEHIIKLANQIHAKRQSSHHLDYNHPFRRRLRRIHRRVLRQLAASTR